MIPQPPNYPPIEPPKLGEGRFEKWNEEEKEGSGESVSNLLGSIVGEAVKEGVAEEGVALGNEESVAETADNI